MPIVSVVLPTYNNSDILARAVESVLGQSFSDFELLIINDGSTDATVDVVTPYLVDTRVRLVQNDQNIGLQKTLNRGLVVASGLYIARIDADDVWCDKDKLLMQVAYLKHHPECVLVGTGVIMVDEHGIELSRRLHPLQDANIRATLLTKNCFAHSSVLFKKEVACEIGLYSEDTLYTHIEDYELWLRMGMWGTFANLPSYALLYRVSDTQISSRYRVEQIKKTIALVTSYRTQYPHFYRSLLHHRFRLFFYCYIRPVLPR